MFEAIFRLVIVLGILVFVHEFGHFIVAKLVGIRVERFSLGFPPRMFGKKIGETDYCISWIPLGGYVKMAGMIDESLDSDAITGAPYEFMSKPIYQRLLVILAGPVMNIFLAIFLFGAIAYFVGIKEPVGLVVDQSTSENIQQITGLNYGDEIISINGKPIKSWESVQPILAEVEEIDMTVKRGDQKLALHFAASLMDSLRLSLPPIVGKIVADAPAMKAGLKKGDRIVAIDSLPVKTWNDLTEIIHASPGKPLNIQWERGGQIFSAEITPNATALQGKEIGLIGISYPVEERELGPFESVLYGFDYCWRITQLTYHYVKLVIKGERSFREAFGGPIMIAKMAKDSAREGESNFIVFIAFISLNLGLINLLPIPVLDGGHIIFLLIEAVIRRPIPNKTKLVIQQIGMVILIAFMLFVIINDIGRLR